MSDMNLFEVATRANYQFPFRGMINVIDLWDLSLTNLDSVFKTLNAEVKKFEEESLLHTKSKEDDIKNAETRQKLLEIKAKRQNAALENMSDEELDKALAELE